MIFRLKNGPVSPQAKTIDLCNNPKTKEPKLQAARRILPEWEGLDKEQAEATAMVEQLLLSAAGEGLDRAAAASCDNVGSSNCKKDEL